MFLGLTLLLIWYDHRPRHPGPSAEPSIPDLLELTINDDFAPLAARFTRMNCGSLLNTACLRANSFWDKLYIATVVWQVSQRR
jgi:hypothetical protein